MISRLLCVFAFVLLFASTGGAAEPKYTVYKDPD